MRLIVFFRVESMIERISTGIEKLDSFMEGGIPKGSITLLAGESGCGKTTFSLQWLADGDAPSYYYTYQPKKLVQNLIEYLGIKKDITINKIGDNRGLFDFDLSEILLENEKTTTKVAIDSFTELIDYQIPLLFLHEVKAFSKEVIELGRTRADLINNSVTMKKLADDLHAKITQLASIISKNNKSIDKDVKESLLALNDFSKKYTEKNIEKYIQDKQLLNEVIVALGQLRPSFFGSEVESFKTSETAAQTWIRKYMCELTELGHTIMVTAESPYKSNKFSRDGILDFLVDNVIYLTTTDIAGERNYMLSIHKMRMTNHERNPIMYGFSPRGIVILD